MNLFSKKTLASLTAVGVLSVAHSASAANLYSEDFEGYAGGAVAGFEIGNIVNGGAWWGGGAGSAPGDSNNGYSAIINEGGAAQGNNQLSTFTDYNPWSPFTAGPGTTIEAFVFTNVGSVLTAANIGETLTFSFDAKLGNIIDDPATQAEAFIKVLDSIGGTFNELVNETFDSDALLPSDQSWGGGSISKVVDAGMVGQLVQVGFRNIATDWAPSGLAYDNLSVDVGAAVVPVPAAAWLFGSALLGLAGIGRKRRA